MRRERDADRAELNRLRQQISQPPATQTSNTTTNNSANDHVLTRLREDLNRAIAERDAANQQRERATQETASTQVNFEFATSSVRIILKFLLVHLGKIEASSKRPADDVRQASATN